MRVINQSPGRLVWKIYKHSVYCSFEDIKHCKKDMEGSVGLLPHLYTVKTTADTNATSIWILHGPFTPKGHAQIKTELHSVRVM